MADQNFTLRYKLEGDASGMRTANRELEKFDRAQDKISKSKPGQLLSGISGVATGNQLSGFTSQITSASSALGALPGPAGAAAAAIAVTTTAAISAGVALFNLTKEAADYGSAIYDASVKTGLSAETMSALKLAADRTGGSLEAVATKVTKFSRLIGEANQGSEKATETLSRLGIDPKKAANDLDGALGQVIKRISEMQSPVARATAAQQAFGKSGAELLKIIDDMKGDLPGLIAEAKRLGVTMTDEDARAADQFGDQMTVLGSQFTMVKFKIGRELMPVFLEAAEDISSWIGRNQGEFAKWGRVVANAADMVIGAFNGVAAAINAIPTPPSWMMAIVMGGAGGKFIQDVAGSLDAPRDPGWGIQDTRKPRSNVDDDFLENIKAQKDAAEKARKEREEIAKRDAAAQINILKEHLSDSLKLYRDTYDKAAEILKGGGDPAAFKSSIAEAAVIAAKSWNDIIPMLEDAENTAGSLAKKTTLEWTQLAEEQNRRRQELTQTTAEVAKKAAKDTADAEKQGSEDSVKAAEASFDRAMNLTRAYYEDREAVYQAAFTKEELSAIELQKTLGNLRILELQDEKGFYEDLLKVAGLTAERRLEIENRIAVLSTEITTTQLKNASELEKAYKDIGTAIKEYLKDLKKANARPEKQGGMRRRRTSEDEPEGFGDTFLSNLDRATGQVRTMDDVLKQMGATASDVFMQMGEAVGASVQAWALLGSEADISLQKMVASTLAGVAAQSATLAIFHLAMGIAALTPWGAAVYGPAPLHFKAAALWGGIALGTALGARATAGDSFKQGSDSGSVSSGSSSGQSAQPQTYTRTNSNAYMSGNQSEARLVAAAVDKLNARLDSMRPGDVLTVGIQQRRGLVIKTVNQEAKQFSSEAQGIVRKAGVR